MERYYSWTIGCQMNKADSERLEGALTQLGLSPTDSPAAADLLVVNSCVVRQNAEDKVTAMLGTLKPLKRDNPERVVALMGCMVGPGREQEALRARFPYVDVFMQPQNYAPLLELLGERLNVDIEGCIGPLAPPGARVTAFVPIIQGCDKFCSFCIIPYRRGRQVSKPVADVVREVSLLAQRGVREVTLLGQTVDAYGYDLPGQPDLAALLGAVHDVDGIQRIRFLTSHPSDMTGRIIQAVADLPKVCENFNVPFQAGDDTILEHMRRGYTNAQYRDLVHRIRCTVPNVAIVTDLIVGFPGESEAQFQHTYDMVRDLRFDKVHTAMYSPRPNTLALRRLPDDVTPAEKHRRMTLIDNLQAGIQAELNQAYVGNAYDVLVDGHQRGQWTARTRTDKLVYLDDPGNLLGQVVEATVHHATPWSLRGKVAATVP